MQPCDILILPRWCIPVEPHGLTLTGQAVAVSEGRIVEVLGVGEAKEKYRPRETIDRPNHVLVPGLINAHTHAAMTLFRGIADDLPLERWLSDGIWPSEKRWTSAEMVRDGTRHAIAEMLRSGVTCFSDQYFFPEVVALTAAELHMRAVVGTPVIDMATAWANDAAECIHKGSELVHDRFANDALISSCFAPHSMYTVSDESFNQLRIVADQLDKGVQIHLHETMREVEDAVRTTGKRPLQRLADLGLVNASLLAVHATHLNRDEIDLLASAGVSVAHCPRSNLKLASGIANVPAMQAAGINVALGTDSAASNNVLEMLGEMRTAALLAKVVSGNAAAMTAAEVLRMATLGSAEAIGLADSVGSIQQGKWADLACISLQTINSQPVYDPLSQLVYTTQPDQVTDVWVAGRQQVAAGRLTEINEMDLLERSLEWQQRISAEFGS